jgi:hypothetical protein
VADLTQLDPQALVVLAVAISGLALVLFYYRKLPRWLVFPYGFFVLGAVVTNAEALFHPDLLNLVEHAVANLGVGLAFALVAYLNRRRIRESVAETQQSETK